MKYSIEQDETSRIQLQTQDSPKCSLWLWLQGTLENSKSCKLKILFCIIASSTPHNRPIHFIFCRELFICQSYYSPTLCCKIFVKSPVVLGYFPQTSLKHFWCTFCNNVLCCVAGFMWIYTYYHRHPLQSSREMEAMQNLGPLLFLRVCCTVSTIRPVSRLQRHTHTHFAHSITDTFGSFKQGDIFVAPTWRKL